MQNTPKEILRVVFIGGGPRTLKTFQALLARRDVQVLHFLIQQDYPNEPQIYPELESLADQHAITWETSPSAKRLGEGTVERVRAFEPDVILRGGNWRAVLPPRIWETARYGSIGLHGSKLPEYRGWANINWYVINGEPEYGLQMYRFNKNIDDGDLVYRRRDGSAIQARVDLRNDLSIAEILEEVDERHVTLMMELVTLLREDGVVFVKQDPDRATWTCHRGPRDGEIDWTLGIREISNFIRGQGRPYPGAFSFYQGKKIIVWKASAVENPPRYVGRIPGKVVDLRENGAVWVLTGDGILEIEEIGVEGGESLEPRDVIRSVRQTLGYDPYREIESLRSRLAVLEAAIGAGAE